MVTATVSAPTLSPELQLDNLRAIKVLGKGALSTVFLVHDVTSDPSASSPFALKVVDKSNIHAKPDSDRRARWEVSLLSSLSVPAAHPFLPHLIGSFETDELLGWAVPYCSGGDLNVLRYHQTDRVFSTSAIRFYLAEILCALAHLHDKGIAYRDLKPENILIQSSGHVTLTDFDLSRHFNQKKVRTLLLQEPMEAEFSKKKHGKTLTRFVTSVGSGKKALKLKKAKSARVSPESRRRQCFSDGEKSNSFVGTEEYVAPEIIRGDGHEFSVDWWALGILTYEMVYGKTPFKGKNRKETFRNVVMNPPEFIGKRTVLTDLMERLLEKDPTRRLGYYGGTAEIMEHEFFNGLKWDLLTEVVRPPFIPSGEKVQDGVIDIREHFHRLKHPPSIPPSPSSLTEF